MRLPEKLMGYVEYEGVNYPFNFEIMYNKLRKLENA